MNDEQFKQLIARHESGKASDAEIKLLENWLERRAQNDLYGKLATGGSIRYLHDASPIRFWR
jgi:hypothetical protein